ncbi:V-type ATPase 116kDa subunit family protein [Clostridium sp. AM58-1XD]|uniref:V-type ATP synthase subunit I n=1 Tax=Clostridium sp. AM58-1XD TaxID=2292307 RepID=UPI000E4D5CC0|nr:V-type ATPase 116kDa subunit family protein [Clostridium sp. AM58-1XD]RGY97377.1 ATPase [Clostridium sp. AM58-1XD]
MIETMKFLSITGPKSDIDRVVDQYLSKYEIHLENALSELRTVKDLRPFTETNPYKDICQRAEQMKNHFSSDTDPDISSMPLEKAVQIITELDEHLAQLTQQQEYLKSQVKLLEESKEKISPFTELNYNLSSILHFQYIKFRFGRVSKEYYAKLNQYVYDTIDAVVYKCQEDDQYVWFVYFVPESISKKIDAIFASLHFERFYLPDEYEGTPLEANEALEQKIKAAEDEIVALNLREHTVLKEHEIDFLAAAKRLSVFATNFNVRKLAACTRHEKATFFILCGWMEEKEARAFQSEIQNDSDVFCIVEDDHENLISQPPTRLHNPKLFKPFELFINMYGLPAYNEFDPTVLVGITYSILFGFMFGDAGQGLCLLVGGYLLYKAKRMNLAAIISCCGFFSTIFGFLFGSIFGFEDIIQPLWLRPADAMMNLPFIGKLNTVFIVAVAIGMGIILLTMILNMINSYKNRDTEKMWFDTNGAAGLVFYAGVVAVVLLFMTGNALPAGIVLAVMFVLPLLVIFFKEPLTAIVKKKADVMPKEKGMFFVQGFFELFEVLLSYFSNTLSFVRVGAFAVSHAAMMQVVLMLAGAESGGNINWIVVVLGNLFVCGMEGLIVGIQVLRLEYYELFSRFYRGDGREFRPYGKA